MAAATPDDCASGCEAEFDTCVGFTFAEGGKGGLCFLFSKFKEVTYFPCKSGSLLQGGAGASAVTSATCMAKLSRFEGTTLKPDPSGKCKNCLKKADKVDWCPTK